MAGSEKFVESVKRFTIKKKERLKHRKSISEAYTNGRTIQVYPLRAYYTEVTSTDSLLVKAAFAIPKRNFKKSVDRNLLKRKMREAYRLNQYLFKDRISGARQINLVLLYFIRDKLSYQIIEKAAQKILKRLAKELQPSDA